MSTIINIPINYGTLSTRALAEERQRTLTSINEAFTSLNVQFRNDPKRLDVNTIEGLFKNLKEINRVLETRKQEATHPRRCCNFAHVSKVTWVTFGLEIAAGLLVCGATIANFVLNNQTRDEITALEVECDTSLPSSNMDTMQSLNLTTLITTIIAMGILAPIVNAVRESESDRDHLEVLMGLSDIKEDGRELRKFIKRFKDFQVSTESSNPQNLKGTLCSCVETLDKVPPGDLKKLMPDRDQWISAMLQLLPDNHSIKNQLRKMRDAAIQTIHNEQSNTIKLNDSTSSDDDDNDSSSSSHTYSRPNKQQNFISEKSAACDHIGNKLHISRGSDKVVVVQTPVHISSADSLNQHSLRWYQLEKSLGFNLDRVEFEGVIIDRNCNITQPLSQSFDGSSSSDDGI